MRKLMDSLDMTGNEIINVSMQKITSLPSDNLFTGRLIYLESESEETPSGYYYYNGEDWVSISSEGGGSNNIIDHTKINVIENELEVNKFDSISDARTYINSNSKPKSVIIGNDTNVTSIGDSAFSGCTSLTNINIPSSVTSIGYGAFSNCTSLSSVTIPSSVTSIGNSAFSGCKSLESITIPNSVTTIGDFTFYNCTSLKSIIIPNSVTSIGGSAFMNCTSLTSITIPNSVTSIGDGAFQDCTSLTSITIPNSVTSISNGTFDGCTSLTNINIPNSVTSIGYSAFIDCTSLKSITIPGSVLIANNTFKNCDILALEPYKDRTGYPWGASNIYIQNEDVTTTIDANSTDRQVPTAKSVYSIYEATQIDDTKINVIDDEITVHTFDTLADAKTYIDSNNKPKSVVIGSNAGVTSIDDGAFKNCKSLTSITIPNGVTSIGNYAFKYCAALTSITIPNSVTNIGNSAFFGCTSLTSISIPNGVTSIGDNAFIYCAALTSITIPSSVTKIGSNAFQNCTSLTSITIPSSVTSILGYAFAHCTSLTSITIPSGVTTISGGTFYGCTSLTSITIPSSVTSIGIYAFRNCTSLTSITIPNGVTSIASDTFQGCDILALEPYKDRTDYPWGATSIYIQNEVVTTTIDENSTDREVPTAKSVYDALSSSGGGGSSLDDTKINVMCEGDPELYTFDTLADTKTFLNSDTSPKHVTIGSNANITSIDMNAFKDCTSLTSITIPSSVTSIDYGAFSDCSSLTSISIPSSVTSIGSNVFYNCTSLKSITIPSSVTSISGDTFMGCTSLTSVNIPSSVTSIDYDAFFGCTSLTNIIIPNSVTSIGKYAFNCCTSLTYINIPSSVASIGNGAFYGCTSLTSIDISSSVTKIGSNAFQNCTSLTSINIPNSVTIIADYAFQNCTSLTSITIPSSVASIDSTAFTGCDILALEPYKERTGYPWGATNILIQNEDVTTTIDQNSTDRQVPTAKAIYNFIRPIFGIRYGFRINKNNSDPDTRVEYLYDAVGMTPAKMTYDETTHKGTFDYGSWGNVWFIKNNRPVKLNFNGTVEAELNPNNYWETVDGQDSELETSTNCNFMSEIPIVYVKRWEDENYNYVVVCDKQYDEDYLAYANTDKDCNLKPLYAPMFKGYKDSNNILRSIAGVDPMNNTTTSNEVMYSNNINTSGSVTGWQIEDVAKHELISDLLTLISKNTDSQTVFGNGVCQTSTRVFTGYNEIVTNTKTVKSDCGQFCGYNDNTHHVSIFHIQDFWGNRFDRCLGLITSGGKYYYKMTPENGGYVYSRTITDYTNNRYTIAQDYSSNDITPPASGYIKNQSTGIFGNLPINTTGASNSTYYCDNYWYNSSGVCLLLLGGGCAGGRGCGSRYFDVGGAPSGAYVDVGASPFYV